MLGLSEVATDLLIRLGVNLLCIGFLVRVVYMSRRGGGEFAFAQIMLNVVTFSLAYLMNRVPVDIGFGLGLFAIFGILRYRTEALRIGDLTYLFIAIGIAVINGVQHDAISLSEVAILNIAIVTIPALLEWGASMRHEQTMHIVYDRVDLLKPDQRAALQDDLRERLGIDCVDIMIGDVNLLRETVRLTLVVRPEHSE
jgi:hypothetical protein